MGAVVCRPAALADAAEIHELMQALAPEIPLRIDSLEREEALYGLIRNCARSGESWVAEDEAGRIVGVVLVEPIQLGRHYGEHEMLELHHAGVAAQRRGEGIFGALMARVLVRMVPVTTTVSRRNSAGAERRLERLGFRPVGSAGGEARLRWEPGRRG